MPVKSMEVFPMEFSIFDDILSSENTPDNSTGGATAGQSLLLSDDIWKKFELDFAELGGNENDLFDEIDSITSIDNLFDLTDVCEIRNHDCMWAGHCGSKEHPADEPRSHSTRLIVPQMMMTPGVALKTTANIHTPATTMRPPKQQQPVVIQQQQQSLLKPNLRVTATPMMTTTPPTTTTTVLPPTVQHTPQTPPMSDDEEKDCKPTNLLQILHDAISNCDLDEDSDLCDYFKEDIDAVDIDDEELEEEEEEEEEDDEEDNDEDASPQMGEKERMFRSYQLMNDHSYFKDQNATMRMTSHLGIETPSESEEEEIDVVSVNDKINSRIVCSSSLPTNPSSRDRQQLEGRMATAITKKQQRLPTNNGVKTILPISRVNKQSTTVQQQPANLKQRRIGETRGVKRSRYQYRVQSTTDSSASSSNSSSPYKRRTGCGNSSDSEPEPSEKRSLHNNMERQRRIDLRNAFEDLRVLVPEVNKKDRAPKVVILREAAQYCDHLSKVSCNYKKHEQELRKKQEWLRQRVSQLRRSLAAKR